MYVDDLLGMAMREILSALMAALSLLWPMDPASWLSKDNSLLFLGIMIEMEDDKTLRLGQQAYAVHVVDRFGSSLEGKGNQCDATSKVCFPAALHLLKPQFLRFIDSYTRWDNR